MSSSKYSYTALNNSAEVVQSCTDLSVSTSQYLINVTKSSTEWLIINRGGFARLTGMLLVPSQFIDTNLLVPKTNHVQKIKFNNSLHGVIYYPSGWSRNDHSRCLLYFNPNGVTIASYFDPQGHLIWTPGQLAQLRGCPIIMFDYRGTGLNWMGQDDHCSSLSLQPTYSTLIEDGIKVIREVINQYECVEIWGSSLGGGVSTIALEYLSPEIHELRNRVALYNHDSFTKTSRVVMPNWPHMADLCATLAGGMLDAVQPMQKLVELGCPVTILCHLKDPVIPPGARLVEAFLNDTKVNKIYSSLYGHADLSSDFIKALNSSSKV